MGDDEEFRWRQIFQLAHRGEGFVVQLNDLPGRILTWFQDWAKEADRSG